eukprot:6457066-Amphidinium_carterae.1
MEPALVNPTGEGTVWTDGSGRHRSDPQHRRCGVGYYTDTQERVWLPLPGLKQSVCRAEFKFLQWHELLKSANRMKWLATAKELSRLCKTCKQDAQGLKVVTGTLNRERCKHCFLDSESGG